MQRSRPTSLIVARLSMESKFEYRSQLGDTPLPEALETINRYRVPGVLQCDRDGWIRKIFILDGEIIFATSNNLYDSLGDFLLRHGRIDRAQYDESVVRLKASGRRQGLVLIDMGLLTPKSLFECVVEQVQDIVWDTFNWDHGQLTFQVGRHKDDELIKLHIPTRRAILRGILGIQDARRLIDRLGGGVSILAPEEHPGDPSGELGLDAKELAYLQSIRGKTSVRELSETGPGNPAHNARLLYAFLCLKLIRRKEAIRVHVATTGGEMADPS